jgi:subtilisin family serine protease
LLRGTLLPFTSGLATVLTVLGVMGFAPAIAATAAPAGHGNTARGPATSARAGSENAARELTTATTMRFESSVRDQEWWLAGLQVPQAWQKSQGSGITVAILSTGVDASYPGLTGSVITGPDYTGSGRTPGSPYWGFDGTAVAGIIASHQPGSGLVGVAPAAKILSVRVTLEFNDPLASDQTVSRQLPEAIAEGIRYAADHGARVIDLPLDPGTLGLTSKGDPAAAGGSPAEQAAVGYALSKGVVLVAPAGDDGLGADRVNYPAAYPGVIAVGAVDRTGHLASFSSTRPYVSLTAPGVSLVVATPPDGYATISSTSTASGIVAGVAALVLSRFPHLTVAQVTQALIESTVAAAPGAGLPPQPARSAAGAGYGTVDAIRAVDMAAIITASITASQPHQPAPVASHKVARHPVAAPHRAAASALAGSVLRAAVAAVVGLIVLLVIALLVIRFRRERGRARAHDRPRTRGQHENGKPDRGPAAAPGSVTADDARAPGGVPAARPSPSTAAWASPAGWQGGGIGEISPATGTTSRPVVAPLSKSSYRAGRGAGRPDASSGPPWAPAHVRPAPPDLGRRASARAGPGHPGPQRHAGTTRRDNRARAAGQLRPDHPARGFRPVHPRLRLDAASVRRAPAGVRVDAARGWLWAGRARLGAGRVGRGRNADRGPACAAGPRLRGGPGSRRLRGAPGRTGSRGRPQTRGGR